MATPGSIERRAATAERWWLANAPRVIQAVGLFIYLTLIGLVVALVAQESLWLGGALIGLLLTVALHVRLRR
jgi:hypothetical protein